MEPLFSIWAGPDRAGHGHNFHFSRPALEETIISYTPAHSFARTQRNRNRNRNRFPGWTRTPNLQYSARRLYKLQALQNLAPHGALADEAYVRKLQQSKTLGKTWTRPYEGLQGLTKGLRSL